MEMDIDIEEHDVLDNPRIQAIFPDLSLVKAEPNEIIYDEEELDFDDELSDPEPDTYSGLKISSVSGSTSVNPTEESNQHINKIIIGSKPNSDTTIALITRALEDLNSNGMKLSLNLQDMGSILHNSGRFCGICQTLFKTHYSFDTHNQVTHSLLQLVRNKAVKSTAKPQGSCNTARKSTSKYEPKAHSSKVDDGEKKICNHCNVMFPNGEALVKHLYDLLIKKFRCNVCNAAFSSASELQSHAKCHLEVKVSGKVKADGNRDMAVNAEVQDYEEDGTNKFYRCSFCSCFFSRIKNYNKHMAAFNVTNFSYRKFDFNGQCKICKCEFATPTNYNKHLIRNHGRKVFHEAKPSLNLTPKADLVRQPVKMNVDPQTPDKQVVNKPATSVFKYKLSKYRTVNNPPIPKSLIFKCSKCQTHFLTCFKATCHWIRCTSTDIALQRQCQICRRIFIQSDMDLHMLQHTLSSKFKVYLTQNKTATRVLCKCPECEIHFDEYSFWTHAAIGCDQGTKYELCRICNLHFHTVSYAKHLKRHKDKKLGREDFIIVDFVINPDDATPINSASKVGVNSVPKLAIKSAPKPISSAVVKTVAKPPVQQLKRSLLDNEPSSISAVPSKKMKLGHKVPLYYCKKCKSYMSHFKSAKTMHLRFKCLTSRKQICMHCGLCFAAAAFNKHRKTDVPNNITLNDYVVYTMDDSKRIKPPLPAFPKCKTCSVHIPKKRVHNCVVDKVVKCDICKANFTQSIYKLHRAFHFYGKPRPVSNVEESVTINEDGLPEMLKKYEAMQKIWNILYLCGVCDIATDSYDKAINHCHTHFYNNEKVGLLRKCNQCNLKFEGACFEKHKQYHSRTINRDSFDIFKYDYKDISLKDWLFGPLPQEQVTQIENGSIYRYTRFVRMKLLGSGTTDLTVYKCMTCLKYVDATEVAQHTRYANCSPGSKGYPCSSCKLTFNSQVARDEHQDTHLTQEVDLNSFRIVAFNHEKDRELNQLLESIDATKQSKVLERTEKKDHIVYRFYRCKQCEVCSRVKHKSESHECNEEPSEVCDECDLRLPLSIFKQHVKQHDIYPAFNLANFAITDFDPRNKESKDESQTVDLFHCISCDVYFLSLHTLNYHVRSNHELDPVTVCQECGYRFTERVFKYHVGRHHGQMKCRKEDFCIIEPTLQKPKKEATTGTVYKCKDCHVCYLAYCTLLQSHFLRAHSEPLHTQACSYCGIIFSRNSMTRHVRYHHHQLKLTTSQMRIKQYKKVSGDIREAETLFEQDFENEPCVDLSAIGGNVLKKASNRKTTTKETVVEVVKPLKNATSARTRPNDTTQNKTILYKCAQNCDVHFLIPKTLEAHYDSDHIFTSHPCTICNLKFTVKTVKRHLLLHHHIKKCNKKDYKIVVLDYSKGRKEVVDSDGVLPGCENEEDIDETDDKGDETGDIAIVPSTEKRKSRLRTSLFDIDVVSTPDKARSSEKTNFFRTFLFRCIKCDLHFNCFRTLENHFKGNHVRSLEIVLCRLCDLKFTKMSINNHIENQHCAATGQLKNLVLFSIKDLDKDKDVEPDDGRDKPESITEITFGITVRTVYKCEKCNISFMTLDSMLNHCYVANHKSVNREPCQLCGLAFSRRSVLLTHINLHHTNLQLTIEQIHLITDSVLTFDKTVVDVPETQSNVSNDAETAESDEESQASQNSNAPIKLYKCGECNVYYITQATCYKHVVKHTRLHPKEYIECKFCSFQFRYISLQKHIQRHHNDDDYNLDNVLIEEYIPNSHGGGPEINLYSATDKSPVVLSSTADSTVTSTTVDSSDNNVAKDVANKEDAVASTSTFPDETSIDNAAVNTDSNEILIPEASSEELDTLKENDADDEKTDAVNLKTNVNESEVANVDDKITDVCVSEDNNQSTEDKDIETITNVILSNTVDSV